MEEKITDAYIAFYSQQPDDDNLEELISYLISQINDVSAKNPTEKGGAA